MQIVVVALVLLVLLVVVGAWLLLRSPKARLPEASITRRETLGDRLGRTRQAIGDKVSTLLQREGELDESTWRELEETLITGDLGVETAAQVVAAVRQAKPDGPDAARQALRAELVGLFGDRGRALELQHKPATVVVVGVNGTGKTTSIAKLARQLGVEGNKVVLGAADTFRAGAAEQLQIWASKVGAEFVGGEPNSDPASVAFAAYQRCRESGSDVVIVDTAGRLHSDRNLMEELRKVVRVLSREAGSIDETLLVLDATTGQNAIAQAQTFTEAVGVTGIVLTKLDGTARGGVVAAVERQLGIPVKLIGVGEGMDDLIPFEPGPFVDALLGE